MPSVAQPSLAGLRVAVLNWRDPRQVAAGGAEVYAWEVARGLAGFGARVDYVTSRERGQPATESRDGIRFLRRGGRWTVYPAALARLLAARWDRHPYDAVVDCQNGIPFFAPLAVARRRTAVLLVVHHVHDAQFGVHFPWPIAAAGRWLEGPASRWVYRRCQAVAVSPSTIRAMRERLRWRGEIAVIPNGVRLPGPRFEDAPGEPAGARLGRRRIVAGQSAVERRGAADAAAGSRTSAPTLVAVGRLVRHKRLDHVVQLAADLAPHWPGLTVHIVGRGPDEQRIRAAAARLADPGRVVVHGYLPGPAKDALLSTAWLHVSASRGEGWGLSVLEAAALGVPSIAYDVDGLRDAIRPGRTGWLVAPGQSLGVATAAALTELADSRAEARFHAECVRWAAAFDWERSVAALAGLIVSRRAGVAGPPHSWPSPPPAVPAPARPTGATTGDTAGRPTGSARPR